MEPTATAASRPVPGQRAARRRVARALLWLPALVWVVVTPMLFVFAQAQAWTLYASDQPTPAQLHERATTLVWAAVCCAGAPLAGLGLAGIAHSRRGLRVYAVAFALGCLPAVGWAALESHRAPTPAPVVTTCQEHSGGDTRCPGG